MNDVETERQLYTTTDVFFCFSSKRSLSWFFVGVVDKVKLVGLLHLAGYLAKCQVSCKEFKGGISFALYCFHFVFVSNENAS